MDIPCDSVQHADIERYLSSKKKKYKIISFEEALQDVVYQQKDTYYKKWGISWVYRWMKNQEEISFFSKKEPEDDSYDLYKKLVQEKNEQ